MRRRPRWRRWYHARDARRGGGVGRRTRCSRSAREEEREDAATRDPTPSFAFATPEALALVEGQIRRAIGTHASDATWPPAHDPAGAADVLGAALNYVRFATREDRARIGGAWRRRREVMAASVVPARGGRRGDWTPSSRRRRGTRGGEGGNRRARGWRGKRRWVCTTWWRCAIAWRSLCARRKAARGSRGRRGRGKEGKRRKSGGESGGGSGGGSVGPRVDVGGRAKVPGMYWYRLRIPGTVPNT